MYVSLGAHKVFFFFQNTSISLTRFGRAYRKHSCFTLVILSRVQCGFRNSVYWT